MHNHKELGAPLISGSVSPNSDGYEQLTGR